MPLLLLSDVCISIVSNAELAIDHLNSYDLFLVHTSRYQCTVLPRQYSSSFLVTGNPNPTTGILRRILQVLLSAHSYHNPHEAPL
ncbi:hypothetical protein F5Y15DRAFT_329711 [Xylariaceae sp. FL0016]|nr:hypothetical protein F5Y15DRAFT_329711 [Xylariaceae sp. FL0016]